MLEEGYLQEHDFFFPSAPQRITALPHLAVSLAWQGVDQVNLTYVLYRETQLLWDQEGKAVIWLEDSVPPRSAPSSHRTFLLSCDVPQALEKVT